MKSLPLLLFIGLCLSIALLPVLPQQHAATQASTAAFPGWPDTYQNQPLQPLPLSAQEHLFNSGFPGRIAKFQVGEQAIILRWIHAPSRKLHSAAVCYRGSTYVINHQPLYKSPQGGLWGAFQAQKDEEVIHVREQIRDQQGQMWTDVSAWYWAALLGHSQGPWWAVTEVRWGGA